LVFPDFRNASIVAILFGAKNMKYPSSVKNPRRIPTIIIMGTSIILYLFSLIGFAAPVKLSGRRPWRLPLYRGIL
jgi:hypothetical protein